MATELEVKRKRPRYSWSLKRQVATHYLEGSRTLQELSDLYKIPHQTIWDWAKSYADDQEKRSSRILTIDMTAEDQKHYELLRQENELLKQQLAAKSASALESENEALKMDLEYAWMKALAMETIIDLAKEEYGIDLRKNSGAKQPVSSKTATRRQK